MRQVSPLAYAWLHEGKSCSLIRIYTSQLPLHLPHAHVHAIQTRESFATPMAGKNECKNQVRCRDDTVPKIVDTRKHCKVGLRAWHRAKNCRYKKALQGRIESMQQSSATPSLHLWLRKIVACSQPYLLVSTVFGTVSSLHLTSFLMIFTFVRESVDSLYVGMARTFLGRHT